MRVGKLGAIFALALFVAGCSSQNRSSFEIEMYNPAGDALGTAKLSEENDSVAIKLSLTGLTPGLHGIHVHEYPVCEGPDFKSAGNHLNPDNKEHGAMNPKGTHLGDMPNVEADSSGKVNAELAVQGATLMDGKMSLLKDEGTSLVIHEGVDDGLTQPAGDAGDRVACGVIQLEEAANKNPPSDPSEDVGEEEKE
ncbi:superoxide dismutase family protein [Pontibacillus salipaludis]|uniref:Superoxide dismutase [Cu-Zn] n=1 Tax=Pontibacillus salipaludis TaxID=1697394 RepID=A0ABQ1PX66_9BACI|nr:superoxide dismutase family protein [Pontibacillus salipaludis]GGD06382.1 superoxide dismutase [Pontibacillus salipaludis]